MSNNNTSMSYSQERILFPSWTGSNNNDESPSKGRRRMLRRITKWNPRKLTCLVIGGILIVIIMRMWASGEEFGTDKWLHKNLTESEWKELNLKHGTSLPKLVKGNPWRGSSRRFRKDILISMSGCGGMFRRSMQRGTKARVRYSARSSDGNIIDSSDGIVDVVIGSGQIGQELEKGLLGLCAGEAARIKLKDGMNVLVYIEAVGTSYMEMEQEKKLDLLAKKIKIVTGRRLQSCTNICTQAGMKCEEKGFGFVNNCPKMRQVFDCVRCEVAAAGSAGSDMPAHVVKNAPIGHARNVCLVTPAVERSTCDAKHRFTERICACV